MRIAALTIALVLLASCSMPTRVQLANLSAQAIVVASDSAGAIPVAIPAGGSAELEEVDISSYTRFSIRMGDAVLRYETSGGYEYVYSGFASRRLKAQFGADGCIRVLRREQDLRDPAPVPQPAGYPLCPRG